MTNDSQDIPNSSHVSIVNTTISYILTEFVAESLCSSISKEIKLTLPSYMIP